MQLKIALAGEEAAGVQALRLLAGRGHEVRAVFTGARADGSTASVRGTAESLGVAVREASEVRSPAAGDFLREQQVELLLSVHARHLICAEMLAAPTLGAFNVHPGPLPECAGLDVQSWALYEGAERHGVTLHHMTPVFDAGPIAFTDAFDLQASDTGLSVLTQCVRRGLPLLEQLLELLERGEPVPAHPQDLARRRWFGNGPPNEGFFDWRLPARRALDFARACDYAPFPSPWGSPRVLAEGREIAIPRRAVDRDCAGTAPGTVAHAGEGAVLIATADAWVRVEEVQVAGRRAVAAEVLGDGVELQLLGGETRLRVAS